MMGEGAGRSIVGGWAFVALALFQTGLVLLARHNQLSARAVSTVIRLCFWVLLPVSAVALTVCLARAGLHEATLLIFLLYLPLLPGPIHWLRSRAHRAAGRGRSRPTQSVWLPLWQLLVLEQATMLLVSASLISFFVWPLSLLALSAIFGAVWFMEQYIPHRAAWLGTTFTAVGLWSMEALTRTGLRDSGYRWRHALLSLREGLDATWSYLARWQLSKELRESAVYTASSSLFDDSVLYLGWLFWLSVQALLLTAFLLRMLPWSIWFGRAQSSRSPTTNPPQR